MLLAAEAMMALLQLATKSKATVTNFQPVTAGATWDSAANWSANHIPIAGDALYFYQNPSYADGPNFTLDGDISAGTLAFDSAPEAVTIDASSSGGANHTLTLTGGTNGLGGTDMIALYAGSDQNPGITGTITLGGTAGEGTLTINLQAEGTFNVGLAGANLVFGVYSVISGAYAVATTGPGAVTLSGANTYTGGTILNSGILNINSDAALGGVPGAPATNLTFDGGTLQLAATAGAVNLNSNRNVSIASGTTATFDTNGAGNTLAVNGVISGGGSITKISLGTLTLSGVNTFTGGITINGGALNINADAALGAAPSAPATNLTFNGGTLQLAATAGPVILNTNRNIAIASATTATFDTNGAGNTLEIGGIISGATASLTKVSLGELSLSGANTYSGGTIVNGGTLLLNFSASGSPASNIIATGSTLALGSGVLAMQGAAGVTSSQTFGGVTFGGGATATIAATSGASGSAQLTLGAITRDLGSTVNFSLPTSGSISTTTGTASTILAASGAAYATVNGTDWAAKNSANSGIVAGSSLSGFYTASTAGALSGNANISSGIGTTTLTATTTTLTSLRFNQAQATTINVNGKTLIADGILVTSAVGGFASQINSGTLKGASGQDLTVIQNNPSAGLTIGSVIADNTSATGLTKSGAGTLALTGANTYSGENFLNDGILNINGDAALGKAPTSVVTDLAFNGGTLQLSPTAGTFTLNVDRNIAIGNTVTATFDTNGASNNMTVAGVISGAGSLTKIGAGTLTLAGSVGGSIGNTYTGGTFVNSGVLALDFSQNSSPYYNIIQDESTFTIAGGTLKVVPYGTKDPTLDLNGAQIFGATIVDSGASALYTESGGSYVSSLFLGSLTRQLGGTADFANLAASTATTTGTANTILTLNGVAFATVGGSDWAATIATSNYVSSTNALIPGYYIVAGSTISGFYTASTATSLSGNANVASGVTTTTLPAGVTTLSSLRFNQAQATTITVGSGNKLLTGGILVTSAVGVSGSQISGGTLEGASGQDLVVIQNNTSGSLTISSVIANNTTATGLTQSGAGSTILTGANTFTGPTTVNGGALHASLSGTLATTSGITVNDGGTLELDVANALGSASVPSSPAAGAGSLAGVASLTLNGGGLFEASARAGNATTIGLGLFSLSSAGSTLTYLSTTITININGYAPNGDELTIMDWNGTPKTMGVDGSVDRLIVNQNLSQLGTLSDIQFNLSGTLVGAQQIALSNGEYEIVAVPEPSTWIMWLLGAATAGLCRRRMIKPLCNGLWRPLNVENFREDAAFDVGQ